MRARVLALVAVVSVAIAGPAAAQPDKRAQAKAAFQRAVAAEERKDWQTAINEYLNAYELAPHPDVLFNVAADFERLEQARAAVQYYQRYLDESGSPPDRDKVEKLIASLRGRTSAVTITTTPDGATVSIDGERRGRAPLDVKLAGGDHQIAAELGGASATRSIAVEFGEPVKVALALGGNGTLIVASNEAGAQIIIDGTNVGVTPWTGALPSGTHRLVVQKAGFTTVERSVDVPPDGTAQVTAGMVHPLGYTPPVAPSRLPSLLIGLDGGPRIASTAHLGFAILVGYRPGSRRWDAFTGIAFGSSQIGYAIGLRLFLATHRWRPYLGAAADLIQAGSNGRVVGGLMIADLGKGRSQIDVYLEGGVGSMATGSGAERVGVAIAGIAWHLNHDAATAPATPP